MDDAFGVGESMDDRAGRVIRSGRVLAAARRARRPARVAGIIAVLSGLINLLSAMLPTDSARLHDINEWVPGQVSTHATAVVAGAGIAMLLLAGALHRRSRTAWVLMIALLVVSAAGHVLKGLDLEEAMFEAFMAGYLVGVSEHFTARPDRIHNFWARGFEALGVVFAAYVFGVIGLITEADASFSRAARGGFDLLFLQDPGVVLSERLQDVLIPSVSTLLVCGFLMVLYRTLAPTQGPNPTPATSEEALATDDSLAWFATRSDKRTIRSGEAGISYGDFGSVKLASGDPLGDATYWDDAIDVFAAQAARQGQYAAVLGCSASAAAIYRTHGFRQLYMGDEAVLDLHRFTLDGGAMKTVRNSCTRAKKAGYVARAVRVGDLDPELAMKLRAISGAWRQDDEERGFSMSLGRLFEEEDAQAMVVMAFDAEGDPRGFLHFVPWMHDGASLDVMRRDRDAIGVLNDFLVAESARLLLEQGINRISLNFSALRGLLVAGAETDAPWNLRVTRWLLLRLSSTFQIETLYRFNKKFSPEWMPRYVMLGALEDAPVVLFAALRAEGLLPSIRFSAKRKPVPDGGNEAE